MDLNKAVDIKKKCQNTQNYKKKKNLNVPDNHDRVITHIEPNILNVK